MAIRQSNVDLPLLVREYLGFIILRESRAAESYYRTDNGPEPQHELSIDDDGMMLPSQVWLIELPTDF